jgi:hypothetical protein
METVMFRFASLTIAALSFALVATPVLAKAAQIVA